MDRSLALTRTDTSFGVSRERRPIVVRAWPRSLGDERATTISVGQSRLGLQLPDHAFANVRFRSPGLTEAAVRADVIWGDAPQNTVWSLREATAGFELVGDGFRWNSTRDLLTIDVELRRSLGLAYGALVDGATSWHLERILRAGGLLLHAACFAGIDAATVVAAPTQRGKSTLCQRLEANFLSEEYAFLVPIAGAWELWWFAERRAPCRELRERWPLRALFHLSPDRNSTGAVDLTSADALAALWPCVLVPQGMQEIAFANLSQLVADVPTRALAHSLVTSVSEVLSLVLGELA
jgi:hypothetical protein